MMKLLILTLIVLGCHTQDASKEVHTDSIPIQEAIDQKIEQPKNDQIIEKIILADVKQETNENQQQQTQEQQQQQQQQYEQEQDEQDEQVEEEEEKIIVEQTIQLTQEQIESDNNQKQETEQQIDIEDDVEEEVEIETMKQEVLLDQETMKQQIEEAMGIKQEQCDDDCNLGSEVDKILNFSDEQNQLYNEIIEQQGGIKIMDSINLSEDDGVQQPELNEIVIESQEIYHNPQAIVVEIELEQQISFIPNFNNLQCSQKLTELLNKYIPKNIVDQVKFGVLVVSFPSIPIFLLLTITTHRKRNSSLLNNMIGFSFGTMLGDVFFHMLPFLIDAQQDHHHHEIDHNHHHDHESEMEIEHHNHEFNPVLFYILGGIFILVIIDLITIKLSRRNNEFDEHTHDHSSVLVFLFSDFLHNFTDGIALGATFSQSVGSGISTTIAIFMHEIPHEIGDFAYLIKRRNGLFKVLLTQIFTSAGCYLGGLLGVHLSQEYHLELISITCGTFLYVVMSNILVEMKNSYAFKPTISRLIQTLMSISLGLYMMYLVGQLE